MTSKTSCNVDELAGNPQFNIYHSPEIFIICFSWQSRVIIDQDDVCEIIVISYKWLISPWSEQKVITWSVQKVMRGYSARNVPFRNIINNLTVCAWNYIFSIPKAGTWDKRWGLLGRKQNQKSCPNCMQGRG